MTIFALRFKVRDYECDMADGVNNAAYMNYFEHARHEFLLSGGIDFAALAREKVGLVLSRFEVDFLASLVSGDEFDVVSTITRISRLRFRFDQTIVRVRDGKTMTKAVITGTPINAEGRPKLAPDLEAKIVALCVATTAVE